jgi:hypothetical protein
MYHSGSSVGGLGVGTQTGEGFIELCVRVDLVLGDANQTSANFHEQNLLVTVGLSQGFSMMSLLDLVCDEADEKSEDVQAVFNLPWCHCNAEAICVNDILNQGDEVYICVSTDPGSDVEIASVNDLDSNQDSISILAIKDGTEDALTKVLYTGKTALIRSQIRSLFFLDPNPEPVFVTGQVSLIFGSGCRSLRIASLLRGPVQRRKQGTKEETESAGLNTQL